jgi:4-hydroxy-tetrahydrodipicolinate synthase
MTPHDPLRGLFVPLITPFGPDGRIAYDALEALARGSLSAGAHGLVALGTTAEAATLDPNEKVEVIGVCARVCREQRAPLIIGAGSNDTRASAGALQELSRWAEAVAALVPVPAFTRPSERGVLAHFEHLARASPLPLVAYHIPYRTGQALTASALKALGRLPGVCAVKYAPGVVDADAVELFCDLPPGFEVLVGDDVLLAPLLAMGGSGAILASAHLATARFVELIGDWRAADVARGRELGRRLARLSAAAFAEPNPTIIKGVLHAQGRIPTADVRLPLVRASRGAVDLALRKLDEAEALPLHGGESAHTLNSSPPERCPQSAAP